VFESDATNMKSILIANVNAC